MLDFLRELLDASDSTHASLPASKPILASPLLRSEFFVLLFESFNFGALLLHPLIQPRSFPPIADALAFLLESCELALGGTSLLLGVLDLREEPRDSLRIILRLPLPRASCIVRAIRIVVRMVLAIRARLERFQADGVVLLDQDVD